MNVGNLPCLLMLSLFVGFYCISYIRFRPEWSRHKHVLINYLVCIFSLLFINKLNKNSLIPCSIQKTLKHIYKFIYVELLVNCEPFNEVAIISFYDLIQKLLAEQNVSEMNQR